MNRTISGLHKFLEKSSKENKRQRQTKRVSSPTYPHFCHHLLSTSTISTNHHCHHHHHCTSCYIRSRRVQRKKKPPLSSSKIKLVKSAHSVNIPNKNCCKKICSSVKLYNLKLVPKMSLMQQSNPYPFGGQGSIKTTKHMMEHKAHFKGNCGLCRTSPLIPYKINYFL